MIASNHMKPGSSAVLWSLCFRDKAKVAVAVRPEASEAGRDFCRNVRFVSKK